MQCRLLEYPHQSYCSKWHQNNSFPFTVIRKQNVNILYLKFKIQLCFRSERKVDPVSPDFRLPHAINGCLPSLFKSVLKYGTNVFKNASVHPRNYLKCKVTVTRSREAENLERKKGVCVKGAGGTCSMIS